MIGWGPIMGKVYHYKVDCDSCGTSYNTKRTKEVYEKVKDQSWILSKNYSQQRMEVDNGIL